MVARAAAVEGIRVLKPWVEPPGPLLALSGPTEGNGIGQLTEVKRPSDISSSVDGR